MPHGMSGAASDGVASMPPRPWRGKVRLAASAWLALGAVLWLLAVLAMASHNSADAAFSTSGSGEATRNLVGVLGAWASDLAYVCLGYSAWWVVAVAARAWLAALASKLRGASAAPQGGSTSSRWAIWPGLGLLLCASTALEWTRLYQWESLVAGGRAGGALGYTLGTTSTTLLGFAGSGVFWIAAGVAGVALAFGFSWLHLAERIGAWVEGLRERRAQRIDRIEDQRLGEVALREREHIVEAEQALLEDHDPILIQPAVVDVVKSARVEKERQQPLFMELADTKLPQVDLLDASTARLETISSDSLEMTSRLIEKKLRDFGVEVRVVAASPGPVITRYEIEPATGVKGSQVVNLAKDLARSLSLVSIRVVEIIPGKTTMALELPNAKRQTIRLSEILGSQIYNDAASQLTMGLGKDIIGNPIVADLGKMPHCLVAGTTGAGKSVGINAMILSLLYKAEARDVRAPRA